MNSNRAGLLGLFLAIAALGATGCQPPPEVDIVVRGCATSHAVRAHTADGTVLEVTADGCLTTTDPVTRAEFRAWAALPHDTHSVRIRTAGPTSAPTIVSRADLERRYGPTPHRDDSGGDLLFVLLPVGMLASVSVMAYLGFRAARAGVFVILFRS